MVHGPGMMAARGFRMDPSVTKQKLKPGTIKRVAGYARPYRLKLCIYLFATAIDAAITVVNPLLLRELIDNGIIGKDLDGRVVTWNPGAERLFGYTAAEIAAIERYALGHGTLKGAPGINHESLREKGFDDRALAAVEAAHPGLAGPSRDLAADLAMQAGDANRAAQLLTESGRDALERGALATAASTLPSGNRTQSSARVGVSLGCL